MTTIREQMEVVKSGWNYADVIALVTAYLPESLLNGDRGTWQRGIHELSRRYPAYFRGVHFVRKDPYPPYSRQVDEILKMLERWEYRSSFNPKYRRIELGSEAKAELKRALEPKLKEHLNVIRQMSEVLSGIVALDEAARAEGDGERTRDTAD